MSPNEETTTSTHQNPSSPSGPSSEASDFVWSFRGYKLRASEFTTAMVHFFRAEVQRANVWRQRLDTTTNWAVVTTGAAISFSFSGSGHQVVILLNLFLVTMFLMIEARRYRYYELWSYRVRLMETDFFAAMLVPPFHPSADWAETLSESLLHPHFPITNLEAVGRRLRRNYLFIYTVIGLTWLAKLWLTPTTTTSLNEIFQRAAIGSLHGAWVLAAFAFFMTSLVIISLITLSMRDAAGEILPRYASMTEGFLDSTKRIKKAWFRPSRRRAQLLTLIITSHAQAVADRVMKDMGRGVTGMPGKGMYTGEERSILVCALTVTEIPHLKHLVASVDPQAFVIVTPASEVLGKGFMPLDEEE